ncbi:MAG TPA: zinc-ribbon domain-containing protein [Acidimicrobiales bacterium]|nr:zinc-ribbon domain-containing protein [Acidimicrobiales bacterium]
MFLIFGIKRMARRLATVFGLCGHCGTPAAQVVGRRSTWFSLFFIPVIPLGTKYFSTCTFCGAVTRIDKAHATLMASSADQPQAPVPQAPPSPLDLPAQAPPPPPAPPLQP